MSSHERDSYSPTKHEGDVGLMKLMGAEVISSVIGVIRQ